MYIEPSEKEAMKETQKDEVKEATEALKGMLGLSSTTTETVRPADTVEEEPTPTPQDPAKVKKNKRKKKKKNNNASGGGSNDSRSTPPKPKGKQDRKSRQNGKAKDAKRENENFAWSAFQSSPDASKLPMPDFSPQPAEKDPIEEVPAPHDLVQTESEDKTPSVKTEKSTPSVKTEKSVEPTKVTELSPSVSPSFSLPERQQQFSGETGVNLAALAAEQGNVAPPPPHPSFANYPPPYYHHHHPNMPPPPPNPYNAPPGFVTIQVRLPMVLPPDRTIVVPSPSGYPISVCVPEGFMEGTVIPVNVPAGPPPPHLNMYSANNSNNVNNNYPPPPH